MSDKPEKSDKFSWGKGEVKITKIPKKLSAKEYEKTKKEPEPEQ